MTILDIIIPCFSESFFLKRLLSSIKINIKEQEQIQIYIVNDCSKYAEEYQEIIKEWEFPNIIYIENSIRLGPGPARNKALEISKGNFVCFADDDDLFVGNPTIFCDDKYDIIHTLVEVEKDKKEILLVGQDDNFVNPVWNLIFNRKFLQKYDLKFPYIINGFEDGVLRTTCMLITNNISCNNSPPFYRHIERKDSNYNKTIKTNIYSNKDQLFFAITLKGSLEQFSQIIFFFKNFYNKHKEEILKQKNFNKKICKFIKIFSLDWNIFSRNDFFNNGPKRLQQDFLLLTFYFIKYFSTTHVPSGVGEEIFIFTYLYCQTIDEDIIKIDFEKMCNEKKIKEVTIKNLTNLFDTKSLNFYNIGSILNIYNNYYYNNNENQKAFFFDF